MKTSYDICGEVKGHLWWTDKENMRVLSANWQTSNWLWDIIEWILRWRTPWKLNLLYLLGIALKVFIQGYQGFHFCPITISHLERARKLCFFHIITHHLCSLNLCLRTQGNEQIALLVSWGMIVTLYVQFNWNMEALEFRNYNIDTISRKNFLK